MTNDPYCIDTLRSLETLGLGDLLAPNCILLVEWREQFSRLRHDRNVEIILEQVGKLPDRILRTTR